MNHARKPEDIRHDVGDVARNTGCTRLKYFASEWLTPTGVGFAGTYVAEQAK